MVGLVVVVALEVVDPFPPEPPPELPPPPDWLPVALEVVEGVFDLLLPPPHEVATSGMATNIVMTSASTKR